MGRSFDDDGRGHRRFRAYGVVQLSNVLKQDDCARLLSEIHRSREFSASLFLDETPEEHLQKKGVNPTAGGFNLLERLETSFIEENETIAQALAAVLGENYSIILKKVICGLPDGRIPPWVVGRVYDRPVPNLGAYIRPEFRDITYFRGIDYHQDIIDFPSGDPDFLTLYVYFHDVGPDDAPLWAVPRSHLLGATTFPHRMAFQSEDALTYSGDRGINTSQLRRNLLTGPVGSVYFWHSSVLHGTANVSGCQPRISLRYLVRRGERSSGADAFGIINKLTLNPTGIGQTRIDLSADLRGNHLKDIGYRAPAVGS
ncbi:phytanoyl-CoA dioxygenase family protein [Inquilinus limosus]|uniref:phytanoyl-CoA dioxygenase family protein n=1 Tax=Inquilinus limosus TaxID=171674 RepID=UPI003F191980